MAIVYHIDNIKSISIIAGNSVEHPDLGVLIVGINSSLECTKRQEVLVKQLPWHFNFILLAIDIFSNGFVYWNQLVTPEEVKLIFLQFSVCWYSQDLRLLCEVAKSICSDGKRARLLSSHKALLQWTQPFPSLEKEIEVCSLSSWQTLSTLLDWCGEQNSFPSMRLSCGPSCFSNKHRKIIATLILKYHFGQDEAKENLTLFSKRSWKSVSFPAACALLRALAYVTHGAWLLPWTLYPWAFPWSFFVAHADPILQLLK